MKFQELKENEPLEIIEVSDHIEPIFVDEDDPNLIELDRIQMRIFTDGEIVKESEEIIEDIDTYYFGKKKYDNDVDTIKTKKIYLKNHSYVITYLISKEFISTGNIKGWFDVVKDVTIYLENAKDRKALKSAKKVIRIINNHNNSVDYSSLQRMLYSKAQSIEKFECEKISKNVYTIKRNKNR